MQIQGSLETDLGAPSASHENPEDPSWEDVPSLADNEAFAFATRDVIDQQYIDSLRYCYCIDIHNF